MMEEFGRNNHTLENLAVFLTAAARNHKPISPPAPPMTMVRFAGALLLAACLLADVAPSLSSDVAESLATAGAKAAASAGAPGADAPEGTCSGVDSDDAAAGSAAQKPCGCAGLKRELMAVETEAVVSAEDMARPAVHLALVFAALDQAGTVPPTPLVRVEGGEFGMGTNKPEIPVDGEGPKRRVAVSAYRIEQMEVISSL